ncbi:nucleoside hydrolase [Pantoea sp. 1.19]|uniref:nucleoside hydrolase n=1 Tax=Pantoea sp. 1.19 TaxID=1925589 RepID=UPI0009489527|nr:nucleoside hydrolase [Pantoea sp. 1.19]
MTRPVIFDCDPGIDDAIALALALRAPELDIRAVTVCAGNQTLSKTLHNALGLLTLMGRADIPVAAGAAGPLLRQAITAPEVHGDSGLGTLQLPPAAREVEQEHAVAMMARLLRDSPEPLTLIATGPLTNIALLLMQYPTLRAQIACVVLMGGGIQMGNVTPVAEFNFYADPEAADRVLQSGVPLVMAGLNVTHQACLLPAECAAVRALNNPVALAVAELLDFLLPRDRQAAHPLPGAAMHDPTAVAWLLAPELFTAERLWVGVETQGALTSGMSVVDTARQTGREPNVNVLTRIDREGFVALMLARLARYG